jgi:hypothetical protein
MGTLAPQWNLTPSAEVDQYDGDTPPPGADVRHVWALLKIERNAHRSLREAWRQRMRSYDVPIDELRLQNLHIGLQALVEACRREGAYLSEATEEAFRIALQALDYEARNAPLEERRVGKKDSRA